MSANASSPVPPFPLNTRCFVLPPTSFALVSFYVTNMLLLLPLCVFVLHHGVQRWRRRRPSSSSSSSLSHSDAFTYQMAVMELVRVFGSALCCGGVLSGDVDLLLAGTFHLFFTWYGQTFFHLLTCVERYLAVVRPVTYRNLRGSRGVRIRNAAIVCAWLLCSVKLAAVTLDTSVLLDLCLFVANLLVVSFCSLSVLRVLRRPGPGEKGGAGERVDRSKRRAFYAITAILGVLALRFGCCLLWAALHLLGGSGYCVLVVFEIWISLSSSLVLPLLLLLREGKLPCRHGNASP